MFKKQVSHALIARYYGEDQALFEREFAEQDETETARVTPWFRQASDADLLLRLKAFRGKLAADFKFNREDAHERGRPESLC